MRTRINASYETQDRGFLKEGMKADITIFDTEKIRDKPKFFDARSIPGRHQQCNKWRHNHLKRRTHRCTQRRNNAEMNNHSTNLDFLGTGGGRFVMINQLRRTAGIRIIEGDTQVHIDPGPGGLVFSNWAGLSPTKLDGLVVTHCHPDHYTDSEVFIEAMTRGISAKRGVLAATKSVLRGADGIGPCISNYHQRIVRDLIELYKGNSFDVGGLSITATEAKHSDPYSVGLRINTKNGNIGYTSDTCYFPGLSESYNDLRLLILCTMWPRENPIRIHLNTDDALKLIEEARPKTCILTHFGMRMLNAGPEKEAEYISDKTGIPVYAASDGLKVTLGEVITLKGPRKTEKPIEIER